jgi:hypothetical protein
MDISAALIVYGLMGSKPLRLLQGITGGILGPRTFSGGISAALVGPTLHFVISFASCYSFLPRQPRHAFPAQSRRPVRCPLRHRYFS